MKAKRVFEVQNFERGQEPMGSLKIGIRNKRSFKTVHECAQFFLDNISKLSEGRFKNVDDLKKSFQSLKIKSEERFPGFNSPALMSKDYLEGFIDKDTNGDVISQKYPPIYVEEWGADFPNTKNRFKALVDFHKKIQRILGISEEFII
jgi:hypothetical protein